MRRDSAGIAAPGGDPGPLPVAGDPPSRPIPLTRGRPRLPPRWLGRRCCGRRRSPGGVGSHEMSGRHPESIKAMAGGHALGFHRRMSESSAIYEPMLPIGWVGQRPADHLLAWQDGTPVPAAWRKVVVQRRLDCGVVVAMERRGFTTLDCAKWPPGVANAGLPRMLTVGELSEAAKPALIARLRLANSLLTLLHAASMAKSNESPRVARVHDRDLYRFDYPDESDEGYWYHPLGGVLPEVVTAADHHRIGVIPTPTVDLALDWLDKVVSEDALVAFDLLNQTQAALVTHDYGLAVVAGWTVCELQVRARARSRWVAAVEPHSRCQGVFGVGGAESAAEGTSATPGDAASASQQLAPHWRRAR